MNIGFFGGTFDPPHNGHISLAEQLVNNSDIDKIIFILSASPPHKPGWPITSFKHRMNMLKLAIKDIDIFSTSDLEFKRLPKPSYMFDTMMELEVSYPKDNLFLIIGEDSLDQLHLWYKGDKIAERWSIITYPRENVGVTLENLNKNWPKPIAIKLLSSLMNLSEFPVSATEIRQKIIAKENINHLVKSDVLNYITQNNLYM